MSYDYMNQSVVTSALFTQTDADSFFAPAELGHTGFAADGFYYTSGAKDASRIASWASEVPSATRGPLASFPTQVLVLACRASLILLDATTDSLNLWMLFYYADRFAFANNMQGLAMGYIVSSLSWANGLLSITMKPDAGATPQAPTVITIDFTQDSVYADTHVAA